MASAEFYLKQLLGRLAVELAMAQAENDELRAETERLKAEAPPRFEAKATE